MGTDSLAEVLEQAFLACRSLDAPLATRLERFAGEVRRINANALEDAQKKVAEHGGQIVAVTPDTQKYASGLKAEAGATFPILTDIDNGYAMSLDLAIWVGEEMRKLMVESGFDPGISQGSEHWMLPIPATFVVGTDGIVKARFVDPDYRKRMEIDELVAALKDAGAGG